MRTKRWPFPATLLGPLRGLGLGHGACTWQQRVGAGSAPSGIFLAGTAHSQRESPACGMRAAVVTVPGQVFLPYLGDVPLAGDVRQAAFPPSPSTTFRGAWLPSDLVRPGVLARCLLSFSPPPKPGIAQLGPTEQTRPPTCLCE